MPEKIMWVIHGGEVYGEKRAIISLMKGMRNLGWEVEALSLTEGECTDALHREDLRFTSLAAAPSPGMHLANTKLGRVREAAKLLQYQFLVGRMIRREIRLRQPQVVHVLNKNILPAVSWAARRQQTPCIWEMTSVIGSGYVFDFNRRLHRLLLRRFNVHPVANSNYTAQSLGGVGVKANIMYLGADATVFDANRRFDLTRNSLGIPEHASVFSIISRIDPSKGQAVFFDAMLREGGPSDHLLLVGAVAGNPETARIRARAENAGAADRLHIIDLTSSPEMYIAISDVVVNARLDAEPFGLSTVEAMMMGKPVLVHALGGPAETALDGVTGWHMASPTVESYATGLARALADRGRWKSMGERARDRALNLFSLEQQSRRYEQIARRLIARLDGMSDLGNEYQEVKTPDAN